MAGVKGRAIQRSPAGRHFAQSTDIVRLSVIMTIHASPATVPGQPWPHSAAVGAAPSPGGVCGVGGRCRSTTTRWPVFTHAAQLVEGVRSSQIIVIAGLVRIDTRSPCELRDTTVSSLPAFESDATAGWLFNTTTWAIAGEPINSATGIIHPLRRPFARPFPRPGSCPGCCPGSCGAFIACMSIVLSPSCWKERLVRAKTDTMQKYSLGRPGLPTRVRASA